MAGPSIPVSSFCGVPFTATVLLLQALQKDLVCTEHVSSVVTGVNYLQTAEHVQEGR